MVRRMTLSLTLALMAALALTLATYAGGWAVVTLDHLPREVQAGTQVSLGFVVRQHGVSPIDEVTPSLFATHLATGETLRVNARKAGVKGHFVLDVTFPRDGAWAWEIIPAPFAGTKFEPLTVAPTLKSPSPAISSAPVMDATTLRTGLRWLGVFVLLGAGWLAVTRPRLIRLPR